MSKLFAYGLSFVSSCIATAILATPMPYVVANNDELGQVLEKYAIKRERIDINSRSYNNPVLMGITGISALVSFGLMFKELSNKPLIENVAISPSFQQPQQMQSQPVVIKNINNNTVRATSVSTQPKVERKRVGTQAKDNSGAWIDSMLFDKNGIVKNQHYKFDGVTQSGKTTLAEYVMSRISESLGGNAEYLLIDPKYLASEPSWSFEPYCKNIDEALEALLNFAEILSERREDPSFDKRTANPIFFIIDEWDWIWLKHKAKALNLLRMLLKVGAELRCFVILLGQSPLCGESTGLNTSDFEQAVRISIGRTASKVLSIPAHYPYSDRDQLSAEAETLNNQGLRFALVQQHSAKASIELVPDIQKPNQPQNQEDDLDSLFGFEPNDKVTQINKNRRAA